ncbi:hypothetical protein FA15DRAFT_683438 [Coprinopsis marcescibilis]|uniref:Uncharacterized protein n=1 Tax=Coprinopsis marcescibilis TaxID=230819 RepID=A0A5C3KDK4_COPMA|nr:hypothetical protein FA15DRAFT_683438 [Coprinopsis marcescibilis]
MLGGIQNLLISLGVMQLTCKVPFNNLVTLHSICVGYVNVQLVILALLLHLGCCLAMKAIMHLYFKFTQPLFVQSLMGLKNLYNNRKVAIHLLGKEVTGDLERPFKVASMFGATSGPQTGAAAIAKAEKHISKKDN